MSGKAGKAKNKAGKPKKKCCDDRPRCQRCPIRMLAEGRLAADDAREIFARARNRKLAKKLSKQTKVKLTKAA